MAYQDQQQEMPQNWLQVGDRAPIDLGPSQNAGPAIDMTQPPVVTPFGKGYYLKGDSTRVVLADNRILDLGRDTGAERARMLEDLKMAKARQELSSGEIESQVKRAQLMELMGIDPSQGMQAPVAGTTGQIPVTTTFDTRPQGQPAPASSQELAGQVSAARQKFLQRKFGTPPTGERWDEQGNAIPIPGHSKPLTEFQGKSSGFGVRAASAHEQLNALEGGALGGEFDSMPGYRNGPVQPGVIKRSAEALPLIGESMGTALNFTQSAAQQRVDQAQRNFVNATLRQESGAAISQGEWDNAKKQYFPQPGDDASVIEQKRLNRAQVINGFKTSAGKDGAAQSSMRDSLQQEMAARAEAIAVIKANPAARAEVIKRMQAAKYSTKGL
jgi:hypothetical protein